MWWLVALALAFGGVLVLVGVVLVVRSLGSKKKPVEDDLSDFAPSSPPVVAEEIPAPAQAHPAEPPEPVKAPEPPPPVTASPSPAPAPRPTPVPPEVEPSPAPIAAAPTLSDAPAAEPTPPVASAEPAEAPAKELIQKLRFSDADLVVRAWRTTLAGESLFAFSTEGFVNRGRKEIVLYLDADAELDVVETLKRVTGFALAELERGGILEVGTLVRYSAPIGNRRIAGWLVSEANEPEPVDFGDHVVLLAVDAEQFYLGAERLRETLARDGRLPWVSRG